MAFALKFVLVSIVQLVLLTDNVFSFWSEFEIRSVELMNGTDAVPFALNLRNKRLKKGLYAIAGTVVMSNNLDEYMTAFNVLQSVGGNNFKPSPISIPRGASCDRANGEYRKFLMNDLHGFSDLPYSDDANVDLCPLFAKGKTFTLQNYEVDEKIVPKFLIPGLYKLQILLYVKGTEVITSGAEFLFNLS